MKTAIMTTIFKDENVEELQNYRFISVLTTMSKLLDKFKILLNFQYRFQKNTGTLSVTDVVTNIHEELNIKCNPNWVFLDPREALDPINRITLRIRGTANLLLRHYFTNRNETVKINGVQSQPREVLCGVSQGIILGSILFPIYINDLVYQPLHKVYMNMQTIHAYSTEVFEKKLLSKPMQIKTKH